MKRASEVPLGLWVKCSSCKEILYHKEVMGCRNLHDGIHICHLSI